MEQTFTRHPKIGRGLMKHFIDASKRCLLEAMCLKRGGNLQLGREVGERE